MSLFDGKPLTEDEIRLRLLCVCRCAYREHANGGPCLRCDDCDQFEDAAERAAEEEQ